MYVPDKKAKRVIRYIYRHPHVTQEKLQKKFKKIPVANMLTLANDSDYVVSVDEAGNVFIPGNIGGPIKTTTRWCTLSKGNSLVEAYIWDIVKWIVPIIISSAGLIISGIALIISIFT